jgi:L-seryl-tRNA(Ser) seleniumtransferase
VYEDLGSGCIADLSAFGIHEPVVKDSIADGVNVVSFSGDKMLGGPQAGIIAGDPALIAKIRRNPMFRALRVDKLITEHLETTLRHAALEQWDQIPAIRMIRTNPAEIRLRAQALLDQLPFLPAYVIDGESVIGGGSTPEQPLPTAVIAIQTPHVQNWEHRLRENTPPVIARISEEKLLIDLRTVAPSEEHELVTALRSLAG